MNRSEAVAVGVWRVRLDQTRTRCLAVAESAERTTQPLLPFSTGKPRSARTLRGFGLSSRLSR